jgi:hypothetical protein
LEGNRRRDGPITKMERDVGGLGPAIRDRGSGLGLTINIEVKRLVLGEEEGASDVV